MKYIKIVAILLVFLIGCKENENHTIQSTVKFSFSAVALKNSRIQGTDTTTTLINSLLISVKDKNGNSIYDRKKIALYNFSGTYLSEPVTFNTGDYQLVEFLVLDHNDNIVYATPLEGSSLAYLVKDPLPITFTIKKDQTNQVTPEVVPVQNGSALDFGYSTFSLTPIKTFNFLMSVFVYDPAKKNFELTTSNVTIKSDSVSLFNKALSDSTQRIVIKEGYPTYTLKVAKSGYTSYITTLSESDLQAYATTPLIVTLFTGFDPSQGLIAFYPFNGNANDLSGNSLHGVVNGAVLTTDRNSQANAAYHFNGYSNIQVANDSLLNFDNNFTLAVWFNMEQAKTYGSRIIDKTVGSTDYGFMIDTYDVTSMTGRGLRFWVGDAWKYKASNLVNLNQWYFVVATFKDGVGSIYINGELNSQNTSTTMLKIITSTTPMRFGFDTGVRQGPDFDDSMVGKIDDVRIYGRVLAADEIKYLYVN